MQKIRNEIKNNLVKIIQDYNKRDKKIEKKKLIYNISWSLDENKKMRKIHNKEK